MVYVFIASVAVFVSATLFVFWESVARARIGGRARIRADRIVARTARATGRVGVHMRRFVLRDVFANVLHMCTYTALVVVRAVERVLTRGTNALRHRARKHK